MKPDYTIFLIQRWRFALAKKQLRNM